MSLREERSELLHALIQRTRSVSTAMRGVQFSALEVLMRLSNRAFVLSWGFLPLQHFLHKKNSHVYILSFGDLNRI